MTVHSGFECGNAHALSKIRLNVTKCAVSIFLKSTITKSSAFRPFWHPISYLNRRTNQAVLGFYNALSLFLPRNAINDADYVVEGGLSSVVLSVNWKRLIISSKFWKVGFMKVYGILSQHPTHSSIELTTLCKASPSISAPYSRFLCKYWIYTVYKRWETWDSQAWRRLSATAELLVRVGELKLWLVLYIGLNWCDVDIFCIQDVVLFICRSIIFRVFFQLVILWAMSGHWTNQQLWRMKN